jgi:hypothetical protein
MGDSITEVRFTNPKQLSILKLTDSFWCLDPKLITAFRCQRSGNHRRVDGLGGTSRQARRRDRACGNGQGDCGDQGGN